MSNCCQRWNIHAPRVTSKKVSKNKNTWNQQKTVVLQETEQSSEHPDYRGGDVTSPQQLGTIII